MKLSEKISKEVRSPTKKGLVITSAFLIAISVMITLYSHVYSPPVSINEPAPADSELSPGQNVDALLEELNKNPLDLKLLNSLIYFYLFENDLTGNADSAIQDPFIKKLMNITDVPSEYIHFRISFETTGFENTFAELKRKPSDAYANFLIGRLHHENKKNIEALQYYRSAEKLGLNSLHLKKSVLDATLELGWSSDLTLMMQDDSYRNLCDNYCKLQYMILTKNYAGLIPHAVINELSYYRLEFVLL
ncbi:MAG: hypothetical protein OEZ34_08200, partial [Spirochaetia bacterium]|nr:hypothetical protein [Spirochaetia bacterium]